MNVTAYMNPDTFRTGQRRARLLAIKCKHHRHPLVPGDIVIRRNGDGRIYEVQHTLGLDVALAINVKPGRYGLNRGLLEVTYLGDRTTFWDHRQFIKLGNVYGV